MDIMRMICGAARLGTAALLLAGCTLGAAENGGASGGSASGSGELATVLSVTDGDTIVVRLDGREERVRYIGVNTPERDETCYQQAANANRALVEGRQVRLERDVSERDPFGRLLRYVYVGDVFVNAELVRQGWAEAVLYEPDSREYQSFLALEQAAAQASIGCHVTGIFDDGSYTR